MGLDGTSKRRWFGVIVLVAAVGMVVCGETVLKQRLGKSAFVLYWLVCFALTGLAILVAFLDARTLARQTRQEHRDLLDSTLAKIEAEARGKARRGDGKR